MSSISNQEKQSIISGLEEINCKLQGESIKLDDTKESIIVARRKPVVEGVLEHLRNPSTTNCNVMIDAETGFGKTYDIGILSHVLTQAGFHHLVAVPSSDLVNQAKKMMSSAFTVNIRTPKTAEEIKNALQSTEPMTIIVTHDLLLHDQKFEDKNAKLWISVDEADSINKQQAFENMCKLDEKHPTTYLTATPKRRILNRCGKVISPTRLSRRCIANAIETASVIAKTNRRTNFTLAFVVNIAVTIIPMITLFPVINSNVAAIIGITSNYWLYSALIGQLYYTISMFIFGMVMLPVWWVLTKATGVESRELLSRFLANVRSLFTREKSSPAHEYVEESEEVFNYNKLVDTNDLLTSIRWNVQSPIGESALLLADDVNSIVNLNFALQGRDNLVYEGSTRYEVYNKFQPEGISYQDYRLKLREANFISCVKKQHPSLTEEQISELKEKVDFSSTAEYLKYRVMHSMIDLTLSYLMKCDNITLDKKRREGLSELIEDVKKNVSTTNDNNIISYLERKGFSEQFARDELLPQIKTVIEALSKSDNEQCSLIVDNWRLSKELHDLMEREEGILHSLIDFCKQNKCIFAGIGKNDLGIGENRLFSAIIRNQIGGYRTLYCDYEKRDFDSLAKYALTTVIDGSKGRGFDSEYNHVASIFADSVSQFNNPSEALQNLGRNRERNESRQSWFFAAAGEKVELFVNKILANFQNEPQKFCQKVLFPATNKYNKLLKNRMGEELGRKIEIYISKNIDALGNIDDSALKKFSSDLIKETYEKVHDINDFDVKKTEQDLHRILKSTEAYLRSYENRIKNNGKLSCTRSALFSVGSAITKVMYYLWAGFDYLVFLAKAYNIDKSGDTSARAYVHIIRNCHCESSVKAQNVLVHALEIAKEHDSSFKRNSLYEGNEDRCKEKIISYFQSKQYICALDRTIAQIENKHLVTILKAVGYEDDANKMAQEIKDFLCDLKNLNCVDLREKYYQGNLYQESKLYKINNQVSTIIDEIVRCHKWHHGIEDLELKLKINHNIFEVRVNNDFSKLREKNFNKRFKERTYLGRAMLLIGFIISMELIGRISSGQTMPLPLLCGFIVFGPLALLCGALLYEITTYLVRGAFFTFGVPVVLEELFKFIVKNSLMQKLLDVALSFGNGAFLGVEKSAVQSFIFEDATKFDSLSDINELTLIREQEKAKCTNEVADKVVATALSAILIQPTTSEQEGLVFN
ncbi:DEAD/DEAH box helicase family protein [Wolbachia endosymbiont (group B) of Longitarsus flavicornis]|uniref:DEAD/DEAH box helicase family protein n=2 Tax=unclassified Wolbachia TaxID=2640676 RepID=UPI003340F3FC